MSFVIDYIKYFGVPNGVHTVSIGDGYRCIRYLIPPAIPLNKFLLTCVVLARSDTSEQSPSYPDTLIALCYSTYIAPFLS